MSETRRKYSGEFRVEAVRLVTEGGQGVAETARELGINANLLARGKRAVSRGR